MDSHHLPFSFRIRRKPAIVQLFTCQAGIIPPDRRVSRAYPGKLQNIAHGTFGAQTLGSFRAATLVRRRPWSTRQGEAGRGNRKGAAPVRCGLRHPPTISRLTLVRHDAASHGTAESQTERRCLVPAPRKRRRPEPVLCGPAKRIAQLCIRQSLSASCPAARAEVCGDEADR